MINPCEERALHYPSAIKLYITNLAIEQASCATIRLLAAARWQVELIFKSLKSGLGIDRLKAASTACVVRSYVWAKLLGAALLLTAPRIIEHHAPQHLSFMRWIRSCRRLLRYSALDCHQAVLGRGSAARTGGTETLFGEEAF